MVANRGFLSLKKRSTPVCPIKIPDRGWRADGANESVKRLRPMCGEQLDTYAPGLRPPIVESFSRYSAATAYLAYKPPREWPTNEIILRLGRALITSVTSAASLYPPSATPSLVFPVLAEEECTCNARFRGDHIRDKFAARKMPCGIIIIIIIIIIIMDSKAWTLVRHSSSPGIVRVVLAILFSGV
jgi:hypothetical protein